MQTHPVSQEFLEVFQALSPEHQEQLLALAKALAKAQESLAKEETVVKNQSPVVERDGFLVVRGELQGPLLDHRTIREEYLDRAMRPSE